MHKWAKGNTNLSPQVPLRAVAPRSARFFFRWHARLHCAGSWTQGHFELTCLMTKANSGSLSGTTTPRRRPNASRASSNPVACPTTSKLGRLGTQARRISNAISNSRNESDSARSRPYSLVGISREEEAPLRRRRTTVAREATTRSRAPSPVGRDIDPILIEPLPQSWMDGALERSLWNSLESLCGTMGACNDSARR